MKHKAYMGTYNSVKVLFIVPADTDYETDLLHLYPNLFRISSFQEAFNDGEAALTAGGLMAINFNNRQLINIINHHTINMIDTIKEKILQDLMEKII